MIKSTRWRPDVCACVLQYVIDNELPDGNQIVEVISETKCARHALVADGIEHFRMVNLDSIVKGLVILNILENYPEDKKRLVDDQYDFKNRPIWSFVEGVLNVNLTDADEDLKSSLRTALSALASDAEFELSHEMQGPEIQAAISLGISQAILI